jgi:hypothetical protein
VSAPIRRLEHLLRLAGHDGTGEHEATTALAGARKVLERLEGAERTRWTARVVEAEKALYLRLNPGAALAETATAATAAADSMDGVREAAQNLSDVLADILKKQRAEYTQRVHFRSGTGESYVWIDEAAFFSAPRPRTMTYTTGPMDPETLRVIFGLDDPPQPPPRFSDL